MTKEEIKKKADELFKRMEEDKTAIEQLQKECTHDQTYEGHYSWRPGCIDPALFCAHCRKMVKLYYPQA